MIGSKASIAPLGAGTPVENIAAFLDSTGLMIVALKRANLIPIQTIKKVMAAQDVTLYSYCWKDHKYIIKAGHSPKLAKSHKESNSAPK